MLYVCILQSFLVYLFNFYYAISELEQNKQNNTIIFFFTIYFFNKKVDLSSLRGGAGAPIAPPLPTGLQSFRRFGKKKEKHLKSSLSMVLRSTLQLFVKSAEVNPYKIFIFCSHNKGLEQPTTGCS